MPLEAPQLDTRKFEDLLREAELRIPRYTPEWTDFNESDPGITLVQLFAWLTEMMLYQMNRVPERNYIKFLQMLGMELQPAQPAMVHLNFSAKENAPVVQSVPPRAQVQGQPAEGTPLIFETLEALDLIHLKLTDVQVFDGSAVTVVTQLNNTQSSPFPPFGWIPQTGSALYLGFTPPPQPQQPSTPAQTSTLFPQQMRFRVFLPAEAQAGAPVSCNELQVAPSPPVTLVWEYRPASDKTRWRRLNMFKDDSVAFTREGYILVQGPKDPAATKEEKVTDEERFWLRVRLAGGTYPVGRAPLIDFIRANVVEAENLATIRDEFLGVSEGLPTQTFTLSKQPVRRDSLELTTVERIGQQEHEEQWQCVDDFLSSGPDSNHFVLNETKGEIRFGDGRRGLVPPAGVEIIARQYRYGGGGAGNLPATTEWTLTTPVTGVETKVTSERPATGGRDEQSVETLTERAPRLLRSRDRAITAEDFAALAAEAGEVCKAIAIPLRHPDHPLVEVPGAVTVVVVPEAEMEDPSPKPSADLISRVCQFLDARRPLTTELFVKGPEYREIRVETRVEANPYAAFDTVALNVAQAINAYLDPLGRGKDKTKGDCAGGRTPTSSGAQRRGWDFGRELFPTNLFSVILQVPDVVAVTSLAIRVDGQPHELNDPVTLELDGLLFGAANHEIVVVPSVDR